MPATTRSAATQPPEASWVASLFLQLPDEILCYIFSFLDVMSLVTCSTLNRQCRHITGTASSLQYTIELCKRRMVLPPSQNPSSSSANTPFSCRLHRLRSRERAWQTCSLSYQGNLLLPCHGNVYEFVGGIYGSGTQGHGTRPAGIAFYELPSLVDDSAASSPVLTSSDSPLKSHSERFNALKLNRFEHSIPDMDIVDFTMDPLRDLLIVAELANDDPKYIYRIHFRKLSTNEEHPHAGAPFVMSCRRPRGVHLPPIDEIGIISVQISGDLLVFLVKDHLSGILGVPAYLQMWNWTSTHKHSACSWSFHHQEGIDDFALLSHNILLIVGAYGHFEVYTFQDPKLSAAPPVLRAIFLLPPMKPNFRCFTVTLSGSPPPGYSTRQRSVVRQEKDDEYCPASRERVVGCCVYAYESTLAQEDQEFYTFTFFVDAKVFLDSVVTGSQSNLPRLHGDLTTYRTTSYTGVIAYSQHMTLPKHDIFYPPFPSFSSASPSSPVSSQTTLSGMLPPPIYYSSSAMMPQVAKIPWDQWGPLHTRWFEAGLQADWQHSVCGLRAADTIPEEGSMSARELTALYASGEATPRMHVRVRDFNPYSVMEAVEQGVWDESSRSRAPRKSKGNGKEKAIEMDADEYYLSRKVVVGKSIMRSQGVFADDVESWLPYTEVISSETYASTDAMIDDRRLLLLKRKQTGEVESVDVFTL